MSQMVKGQDANLKQLMETHAMRLRRKKNKKIWSYFEPVSKSIVRCKICKAMLSCKHTSSNLVRHMFARHQVDSSIDGVDKTNYIKYKKVMSEKGLTNNNIPVGPQTESSDPLEEMKKAQDSVNDYKKSVLDFEAINEFVSESINGEESTVSEGYIETQADGIETSAAENMFFAKEEIQYEEIPLCAEPQIVEPSMGSKPQLAKIRAETRYFNELASLAKAKRIMVQLQTEKLRRELGIYKE